MSLQHCHEGSVASWQQRASKVEAWLEHLPTPATSIWAIRSLDADKAANTAGTPQHIHIREWDAGLLASILQWATNPRITFPEAGWWSLYLSQPASAFSGHLEHGRTELEEEV